MRSKINTSDKRSARGRAPASAPDPFTRYERGSELPTVYGSRRPGRTLTAR
jgi:hypothetical protein